MSPIEIASYAVAILLAASRLLTASEELWSYIPSKFRWLPPILVAAIPQVVSQLGGAKTTLDLVTTLIMFATFVVPGARSAAHAQLAANAGEGRGSV